MFVCSRPRLLYILVHQRYQSVINNPTTRIVKKLSRGQAVKSPNLSYMTESLGPLLSEFSQCLCVQGQGCKKMLQINQLPWLWGQVVKSPNLSYTIPRASSLDSSILLSSEFSQCLRVQGQGCYTFSCISANASREL